MWGRKNLTFKENLGLVYFVLPFISVVKNKTSLVCSILFGKSTTEDLRSLDEETFLSIFEGVPQFKIKASELYIINRL